MAIENIKCSSCYKCISHCALLEQKSRICSRLYIMPAAPFIHHHTDFFIWVILIHNCTMSVNQLIHAERTIHCVPVLIFWKVCRTSLMRSLFCAAVIMNRQTIHHAMYFFWCRLCKTFAKHHLCPLIIISIRTAADTKDRCIAVICSHICLITAIKISIVSWCHISAASPVFISNTKIVHSPRLFSAIFLSEICHRWHTI